MPNTLATKTDFRGADGQSVKSLFQTFSVISDPIYLVDSRLNLVFFNESFLRLLHGWEIPSPQNNPHVTEFLPLLSDDWISDYQKILQEQEPVIEKTFTFPEDPTPYTISLLPFSGGKNSKYVITIVKYHSNESKTANKIQYIEKKYEDMIHALRESEDKFRKLITQMGDGVWLFDTTQKTIFVNPALIKMLRFSESELIGNKITDFILRQSTDRFLAVLKSLDSQSTSDPIEITFRNKSGIEVDTRLVLSSITDPDNQKIGSFCVISDITKEKSLQELQERFIATTAHELRTPLTVLSGYLDVLQIGPDLSQEDLLAIIEKMSRNVNRLVRLVRNVHDLSAVRANLFSIDRKSVNLFEFITELKDQIAILFPNRNFFWDTNVTVDSNISFALDSERIKQTIENLTQNSVKNSPRGSPINIGIHFKQHQLTIVVQDQGTGISNEDMLQLFQPFAHKPTQYSHTGTGLGLYIIKVIIQAHAGTIEVVSGEKDTGCIFTIHLPNLTD